MFNGRGYVLMAVTALLVLVNLQQCSARYLGYIDEKIQRHQVGENGNEEVIISAGETIEIECASISRPEMIKWKYPRQTIEQQDNNQSDVSIHNSENGTSSTLPYYSQLTLANATYRDTGVYQCSCGGMSDIAHVLSHHVGNKVISRRTVYVYVSDPEHLFQGAPSQFRQMVTGAIRGTVVLPCAINSPDNTTVELLREQGYKRVTVIHMNGKKYQYEPKIGFIINRISQIDIGAYACRARNNEFEETKSFFLRPVRAVPMLQVPVLKGLKSISVGAPTSFKCQVATGGDQVTAITWWKQIGDQPATQLTGDDRVVIEEPLSSTAICSGDRQMCSFKKHLQSRLQRGDDHIYIKLTGRLRIHNVVRSDEGKYFCRAWSDNVTKQSNTLDIEVYEQSARSNAAQ